MTTPYTNNKGSFLIVGVPEGMSNANVTVHKDGLIFYLNEVAHQIDFPPRTKWEILFLYSKRTEELAAKVVEKVEPKGYADYKLHLHTDIMEAFFACPTAIESLSTLMDSLKCWVVNPYGDVRPSINWKNEDTATATAILCDNWLFAQPHVHGDYIILKQLTN